MRRDSALDQNMQVAVGKIRHGTSAYSNIRLLKI